MSITCPTYEPLSGGRRCRSYLQNGACAREDQFMCVEWLRANAHLESRSEPLPVPPKPGARLSYSRVDRWERCRLSYRFRYVDKLEAESGAAAQLGKAVHGAIERLELEHIKAGRRTEIASDSVMPAWRSAFTEHGLVGAGVFAEGLEMVRGFVDEQGELDPASVLGVEHKFEMEIGGQTVVGVIDRVDRLDQDTIEIIDFKTNRLLFAKDDLATNLQMSLYAIAAKRLWPWVKGVVLTFWMLRHDVKQRTTRTADELEAAAAYVGTVAEQLASASEYPARPNPLCGYCDYRSHCPAYAEMLEGRHEYAAENLEDLEQVAREREQVAALAKTLYRRKDELDKILKAHLEEKGPLVLAGTRYATFKVTSKEYPLEETIRTLVRATGRAEEELREQLASVSNTELKKLLKGLGKDGWKRPRVKMLEAELGAHATLSHTDRLWAKAVSS